MVPCLHQSCTERLASPCGTPRQVPDLAGLQAAVPKVCRMQACVGTADSCTAVLAGRRATSSTSLACKGRRTTWAWWTCAPARPRRCCSCPGCPRCAPSFGAMCHVPGYVQHLVLITGLLSGWACWYRCLARPLARPRLPLRPVRRHAAGVCSVDGPPGHARREEGGVRSRRRPLRGAPGVPLGCCCARWATRSCSWQLALCRHGTSQWSCLQHRAIQNSKQAQSSALRQECAECISGQAQGCRSGLACCRRRSWTRCWTACSRSASTCCRAATLTGDQVPARCAGAWPAMARAGLHHLLCKSRQPVCCSCRECGSLLRLAAQCCSGKPLQPQSSRLHLSQSRCISLQI